MRNSEKQSFGKRLFDSTIFLACLFIAGCEADIATVEPTLNADPKEIYEITVTVENAPGEFVSAKGEQSFYIANSFECIPISASMSGAPPVAISNSKKINYKRISSNTFVTRVIMDRYIPQDDYGRGLCKWVPGTISVTLYNGINEHNAYISPPEELETKRASRTEFFTLKRSSEDSGMSIPNLPVDESNKSKYPPNEHFFIMMSAKRISR